ncbi:MAG: TonB-dependent receptor [Gemmatimonadales bacterium]|nr:MAG: TonB-dependent receptor [Gemmatimonadales bacterium]
MRGVFYGLVKESWEEDESNRGAPAGYGWAGVLAAVWILAFTAVPAASQEAVGQAGEIRGQVTATEDGRPLTGVQVSIEGGQRAQTNARGQYRLRNVQPGQHTVRTDYMGYQSGTTTVSVEAGQTVVHDFALAIQALRLEGVDVVGTRWGSEADALNRQRTALSIQNVISADQIQRFPDPQAAEAIRRLPGVASFDHRGEPQSVFVRGMAPGMNTVTMDGERLPTTGLADRETSLMGLPAEMLSSMELSKAITPDMDADAAGGTINLVTRSPLGEGRFLNVSAGGGTHHHGLGPNAQASAVYGNRVGDLGVLLRASFRRNDMMMDDIRHFWGTEDFGNGEEDVLDQLRLGAYRTQRDRLALSGRLDYNLSDETSVFVRGLFNRFDKLGKREQFRVRPESGDHVERGMVTGGRLETIGRRNQMTELLSTIGVGGETVLGAFTVDLSASLGYGEHDQPYQEYLNHRIGGVDLRYDISNTRRADWEIVNGNPDDFFAPGNIPFLRYENRTDRVTDRDINTRINFTRPFGRAGAQGELKFGGRYFQKEKDRDYWVRRSFPESGHGILLSATAAGSEHRPILGRYRIGHPVDWGLGGPLVNQISGILEEDIDRTREISDSQNYEASESVVASFMMTSLDWGEWALLGGVRAERTSTSYVGNQTTFDENGSWVGTEALQEGNDYLNFFPMVHLRYRMSDRTNFRLAWTNALARPNFTELAPTEFINHDARRISRGNPALDPSLIRNVDLLFEHYFEPLGLVSGGVFYKQMNDFFFDQLDRIEGGELDGYEVRQTQNGSTADLYGVEIAWQQRLTFLPGVLSGLGIYANYTYTTSNAELRDVTREVPLPRQIPHVLNAAVSWERGPFETVVTMNHRSEYLFDVSTEQVSDHRSHLFPSMDRFLEAQTQFDVSAQYQLPWAGSTAFLEVKNITNSPQTWYDGSPEFHFRSSYNHAWGLLGLRLSL